MRNSLNKVVKLTTVILLGLSFSACTNVADHAMSNDMLYTAAYSNGANYSANPNHVANFPDLVNWSE